MHEGMKGNFLLQAQGKAQCHVHVEVAKADTRRVVIGSLVQTTYWILE
jgi:hypothetical protein